MPKRGDRQGALPAPALGPEAALTHALARAEAAELALEACRGELGRHAAIAEGFMARVNHELRTPLNVVLGFASLARDGAFGEPEAPMAEALDKILEAGERLAGVLGDLLDARRLEEGLPELEVAPFGPRAWLEELQARFAPLAEARGQRLALDLASELPEALVGDRRRLSGAVAALLDNAFKFSPAGSVIQLEGEGLPGGGLRLRLSDPGQGIAPELLPRIFEPFFQGDGSSTRRHGGTGLGLSLARAAIEAHGGRLRTFSEGLGLGTSLVVELPAAPVQAWIG